MNLDRLLAHIDSDLENSLGRLFELLRIPSISTDPVYASECERAAGWLADDLERIGFAASARPTAGHPMVVAHGDQVPGRLLFYGHYDVQPVDPLELWDSDPFEPRLENVEGNRLIRARGADDDKGQLMTFVEACRAWKCCFGKLPRGVSLLIEGEEESGSHSADGFFAEYADELRGELALVCDTGLFESRIPAIVTRLRGGVNEEITITAANQDLHSGMYGGLAANPVRILAKIIEGLHDAEGAVTLPGFYDDVPELPDELAAQWRALKFDHKRFLGGVGLSIPAGESDAEPLEQIWSRPTCDVTGISGGYQGDGFKTVIASQASAKISFRLVGRQVPATIRRSFRNYVRSHLPEDCSVAFTSHGKYAPATFSTDHAAFGAALESLTDEWGKEAVFIGCGGSIPITSKFKDILCMDSLLMGFGKDDDRLHSPNEKYDLESFHKGIRSWARFLFAMETQG